MLSYTVRRRGWAYWERVGARKGFVGNNAGIAGVGLRVPLGSSCIGNPDDIFLPDPENSQLQVCFLAAAEPPSMKGKA